MIRKKNMITVYKQFKQEENRLKKHDILTSLMFLFLRGTTIATRRFYLK